MSISKPRIAVVVLLGLVGLMSAAERPTRRGDYPLSGAAVPELAVLDKTMLKFMTERDIRAGTLCMSRDGKVVFERGYGWADVAMKKALPADVPMRIASLSKPITAAAVRKLIAAGKLGLDDKVFATLAIKAAGKADPRLGEVTVEHLLEHRGGWDREKSGDPMFRPRQIADALGVASPATRHQIAAWVAGRPLDFDPGERRAYSNFGYMLLGLLIEHATGDDATAWAREQVMGGAGDFALGRSLPADREPREPNYFHPGDPEPSVFGRGRAELVPRPDGTWSNEVMVTNGGWRCSAKSYVEFMNRYWLSGRGRAAGETGQHWTFFGSLPGTWTVARQRRDGVSYAAFFNQRKDASGEPYDAIKTLLDAAIDALRDWPE